MKAYLFTLPPVHAPARRNELAFPFNQRWTLAFWNLAFLDQHRFRADPARASDARIAAPIWRRRSAIAANATRRAISASPWRSGRQFGGAMLEGWHAYNITSDKTYGIGDWSDQQIADYLSSGHADGRGSASGPMGEAVGNSLQYLTSDDIAALVRYLRHVEPQDGQARRPKSIRRRRR